MSSTRTTDAPERVARLTLPYRPPYDWTALHGFLAARAVPGLETAGPGFYARSFALRDAVGTLMVSPAPEGAALDVEIRLQAIESTFAPSHPPPHPEVPARSGGLEGALQGSQRVLEVSFEAAGAAPQDEGFAGIGDIGSEAADLRSRLIRLFDCEADPAVIGAGLSGDPLLARLVAARPGLRVPGAFDGFELAVRGILGQQVSVTAALNLAHKLVLAFGTRLPTPSHGLTHLFPRPQALVGAEISLVLNMPRSRGAAISGLAAAIIAEPDLFAPGQGLEAATARLTALRGIGPWTAHYVAMRALREADAFPGGDIGLLRALDEGQGRPSAAELLLRAEQWRPWRAYAAMHLWAHDSERLAAKAAAR